METIVAREIGRDTANGHAPAELIPDGRRRALAASRAADEKRRRDFAERLALPVAGAPPEAVVVRAGDVRFDSRYQTIERFDPSRANRIAVGWDWTRYKAIILNVRPDDLDGSIWCPDGKHRVTGAITRMGPDVRLVGLLHRVPYAGEAAIFAAQHEEERRVSDGLRFNAEKEAGDAVALAEQALLDRLGVSVARNAARMTVPINTFLGAYRRWGEDVVAEALGYAIDDLGGGADAFEMNMTKGLVGFVAAYRDHDLYRPAIVRDVLRKTSPDRIKTKGNEQAPPAMAEADRVTFGLVYLYSYSRPKFRLPTWSGSTRGGRSR